MASKYDVTCFQPFCFLNPSRQVQGLAIIDRLVIDHIHIPETEIVVFDLNNIRLYIKWLPRDLYHGKGALEALKDFEGKKAVICVGGGSMKRNGFLDKAIGYLKEAGMEVELIEGIEPDPSVDTVMKGAAKMQEFQPDWIVAMGGGSPIDAAKAMWIKYEYPDVTFEDMCKVFGLPKLRTKAKFCAISSTSGTATEVTAFSIITDYEKGIKYPIADFEITPDVAIVDPELAETMPKKLVAHTGMDAMTHAIEAYVSTANCDFTDPLALHAIKMIQRDLVGSYNLSLIHI